MQYLIMRNLIFTTSPAVLSNVTLALLEDSGWYSVNYGLASKLNWGLGRADQNHYKSNHYLHRLFYRI